MTTPVRWPNALGMLLLAVMLSLAHSNLLSQESSHSQRRVAIKVTPQYPELARSIKIKGTVKVEAVVAPNRTVKSVSTKGGHPLLVQAAQSAIRQWKWEPASSETRESVEVKFDPQ